jgi:phthalate 3,4-dioxygenase ferredoxin reductase component
VEPDEEMSERIVVVGASVAGVRAVQALRAEGFSGALTLIGAESELPYDKPPLSKQFLTGAWDAAKVALLSEEAATADRIEMRLGIAAASLDMAGQSVVLADGARVGYDSVVIATGASARPSPWAVASGIHVLRTQDDSCRLRADLELNHPVVVVGGGFIGAEVAAAAHAMGRSVTVVDPLPVPIARILGPEVGALFQHIHRDHGVDTRFGVGVQRIEGETGSLRVELTDGEVLEAGTVVVGIGAVPNDAWLGTSGLEIDDGVVCDQFGRAGGRSDVYAVGDVARWFHPHHQEQVRVEHWTNAVEQAACAAHNIVHPDDLQAYSPTEYVWSDQYEWKIQIVGRPGHGEPGDPVVADPLGTTSRFAVLCRDDAKRLCGAVTVNWPKAFVACRRLVGAGTDFDEAESAIASLAASASKASIVPIPPRETKG